MAANNSAVLTAPVGTGSRFAFTLTSPSTAPPRRNLVATSARDITPRDRHRLLADAMKHSSQDVSRDRIVRSLTEGGFAPAKAVESLGTIEQQLIGKRQAFGRSRQRTMRLAYLQIWVSVLLALVGLSVASFTSPIIFGVAAARGVRRLNAAKLLKFSNDVLTHR